MFLTPSNIHDNSRYHPIFTHYYYAVTVILIGYPFFISPTTGIRNSQDLAYTIQDHTGRHRRDGGSSRASRTFQAATPIPEDVGNDVNLFDFATTNFQGTFTVTPNNSAGVPHMFVKNDWRFVRLNPHLTQTERKQFDFETHPVIEVNVTVNLTQGEQEEVTLTIRLPLSDVNDEPPKFVAEVTPLLAQVGSDVTPWTVVYQLTATDEDSHADLEMALVEVEPAEYSSRFKLQMDSRTGSKVMGSIVVAGSELLPESQEFAITMVVEDRNANGLPQIIAEKVQVLVGVRAPQFYSTKYTGFLSESVGTDVRNRVTSADNTPMVVKVVNFNPGVPIKMRMLEWDASESDRFEITDDGEIWNLQDMDFERVQSAMLLVASSNIGSSRTSTAQVHISIRDINDHSPEFSQDNYIVTVLEDVAVDHQIAQVIAGDKDSGMNQDLEFLLPDNDDFYVDTVKNGSVYHGHVKVKRPLDYDSLSVPVLTFTVMVRDQGVPSRTATAHVIITLENANDNKPYITVHGSNDGTIEMVETLSIGSVVTVVQAWDIDGDGVLLSFNDGTWTQDIFTIDRLTGVIKTNAAVDMSRDEYLLTIRAVDDGNCCMGATTLTSTYALKVIVTDINSNKPEFESCSDYDMLFSVLEKSPSGTNVATVKASDKDRGENGRVIYSIDGANSPFYIDPAWGNISVKDTITRDSTGYEQVTVIGRNPGDVPLMQGWCSFRIRIDDVNDHSPAFSSHQYDVEVLRDARPGEEIVTMLATDGDIEENAHITYNLWNLISEDPPIFIIDENSGIVSLRSNVSEEVGHIYSYLVNATDNGTHPYAMTGTTTLNIEVVDQKTNTPSWINPPTTREFFVNETVGRDHVITNLACRSDFTSDPRVTFIVYNAEDSITTASRQFGVMETNSSGASDDDDNISTVHLVTLGRDLDYETRRDYVIHVVCQDYDPTNKDSELTLTIHLVDANDERPLFVGLVGINDGYYVGSAPENSSLGTFVTYVQAVDRDTQQKFKDITFSIEGEESKWFSVERVSSNHAKILTRTVLDREEKTMYIIPVIARDGGPSAPVSNTATRQIQVTVTDVNDNSPSFEQDVYTHSVSESASLNQLVFSVTASDVDLVDSKLDYVFESGNTNGVFSVMPGSGEIRVARKLDYDDMTDKVYRLILQATDQGAKHTATTTVEVTVLDENDNPPNFTLPSYEVKDRVVEHDDSVTNDNPMKLTRVSATDKDNREQTDIRYFLLNASEAMRRLFYVDATTGDVFLTGDLDRDRLDPFYTIGVVARDETEAPLLGYAQVEVHPIDVNERPKFTREDIQASLGENSAKNTLVTKITAIDRDEGKNGTIRYTLDKDQPNPGMFRIEPITGILRIDTDSLDEERDITEGMSYLFVPVVVKDLGSPELSATTTVTVTLRDENDQGPKFVRRRYNLTISENVAGRVLASRPIQAIDMDTDPVNKQLMFNIIQENARFFVSPSANSQDVAFIGITSTSPLDYENDTHTLTFNLRVSDGVQGHEDSIPITVFIQDYNDNPPVFSRTSEYVTLLDGTPRFTNVTQFHASDADEGTNAKIEFSILRASDQRHEFSIHPDTGIVTTRKDLDRETEVVNTLVIIATDKGQIPLSSSATLVITLTDTNDCAPQFREPYRPVVNENTPPDNNNNNNNNARLVVEVFATDPDTSQYGPPFGFQLPSACKTSACQSFRLEYNPDGDGGNGTAIITTRLTFDREVGKEYHLPIVMWDMRDHSGPSNQPSQTATSTLTITIGDENDNPHFPGHQDIHVYNYRGTKGPKEIGRVNARDLDDWDLADKTFTTTLSAIMQMYFSVAKDTGMITMFENVPPSKLQPSSTYDFEVDVYDRKWDKTVTCSVSVTVEELSDEAVRKAGSVRMAGVSAEQFIQKLDGTQQSKYDKFRERLSSILGYPDVSHVDVVSIQEPESGLLDIHVSAHGSPYLNPSEVESAMALHKRKFELSLGVTIVMIPINVCMEEVYDAGCATVMEVTQQANVVYANGTSFVGVQVRTSAVPECLDCNFPKTKKCDGGYCYNGGTCLQDDWGKMTCQCLPEFDGPRCQQRRRHFDGSSVAFYPSLSVCAACRTMFDFITLKENGLVMHSGDIKGHGDYFLFELQSGYPSVRINLGAGELLLTLDGKDQSGSLMMPKLNDGKWHHIDIDKNGLHVQLTVDKCQSPASHDVIQDLTWCRSSGTVPGPDILLNAPGFLHVGGPYPIATDTGSGQGFSGCLKDLIHNTKMYDLSYKEIPSWNSGTANCPREVQICERDATCGERADCVTKWLPLEKVVSCSCQPGWKGNKCDEETPVKDLEAKSFLYWKLGDQLVVDSTGSHRLSLKFRTRQQTGTLFSLTSDWLDSIIVQLSRGKLGVVYSQGLDGISVSISLQDANAANGQWHVLVWERHGSEFSLSLDNGEGRNYRYVTGQDDHVVRFEALQLVSSGARINHVIQDRVDSEYNADGDLVDTCITDVRYNGVLLPMEQTGNFARNGQEAELLKHVNVKDGCSRQDCVPDQCASGTTCLALWEDHECRPNVTMCGTYFCYNGGVCVTVNDVTSCQCVFPWIGISCNVSYAALVDDDDDDGGGVLAAGAIAGMVIGILILLVLLVFLVLLIALRRQKNNKSNMADILDDDLIRENVIYYDEEGAGEKDNDGFDPSHLGLEAPPRIQYKANNGATTGPGRDKARGDAPNYGIRDIIDSNMDKMNEDGRDKEDQTHLYALEGSGSIATSLSSLSLGGGSESSQEYDYLGGWGPKFSRLADIYNKDSS